MIKITGIDLVKFIQKVYELSSPQGMGIIHYEKGGLSEFDAKAILAGARGDIVVNMDYVKGRACKMTVFREGKDLFIRPEWYDHDHYQLEELLREFDMEGRLS